MKLEELKKPARFKSWKVLVNGEPHIAITQETCDQILNDLIGLRVETAHAMGMLRGYRIAMRDFKNKEDEIVCSGSSEAIFDFPIKD